MHANPWKWNFFTHFLHRRQWSYPYCWKSQHDEHIYPRIGKSGSSRSWGMLSGPLWIEDVNWLIQNMPIHSKHKTSRNNNLSERLTENMVRKYMPKNRTKVGAKYQKNYFNGDYILSLSWRPFMTEEIIPRLSVRSLILYKLNAVAIEAKYSHAS